MKIVHVIPQIHVTESEMRHAEPSLVRLFRVSACPLCQAGRCWQVVRWCIPEGAMVVHGLALEN